MLFYFSYFLINNNNIFLRSPPSKTPIGVWDTLVCGTRYPPLHSDLTVKSYRGVHTLPPFGFEPAKVWASTFLAVEKWKKFTIDIHHLKFVILNCSIWIHSLPRFEEWPSIGCHPSLALGGSLISCSKLSQYLIANNYNE